MEENTQGFNFIKHDNILPQAQKFFNFRASK